MRACNLENDWSFAHKDVCLLVHKFINGLFESGPCGHDIGGI
jgi:hypothetical protein